MSRVAVKETTVYKFNELSDKAKKHALQDYHEQGLCHDWWHCVYEDAKTCFGFCGIRIDNIYFSGFWSQGDGACFEGEWHASDVKPGKLKEHAPVDTELHRIAAGFEEIAAKHPDGFFRVKQSGYYSHENSTSFDVEFSEDRINEMTYDSPEWSARNAELREAEDHLIELARDAMRWIYRILEKEYEYQTSEEAVVEMAEANEWEFTEDGKFYY